MKSSSFHERVMAKGKRKPLKLIKPTTALLALSIDELFAEYTDVMNRSRDVRTIMSSGRTSRSANDLHAEHAKLMKRSSQLLNAIEYKRSKTFAKNRP